MKEIKACIQTHKLPDVSSHAVRISTGETGEAAV
jgi:nitrogen regulatory protein PII